MTVIANFYCGECSEGPYELHDNREAPIPNPPFSIHHDDAEGRPLSSCRKCEAELPHFEKPNTRESRERREAVALHDTEPGRWGDHASPARMRRDIERDRDEDRMQR